MYWRQHRVNQDFQQRAKALVEAGCKIITVDIAHGHSVQNDRKH